MKENNKPSCHSTLSQTKALLLGVLFLCILVGASLSKESLDPLSASSTRQTKLSDKKIKNGFRMCLLEGLTPGLSSLHPSKEDFPLPIHFQCAGQAYDHFASNLERLLQIKSASPKFPHWGQRSQPVPSKKNEAPRFLLFLGSSHLRQVLAALLCQYSDQVMQVERIHNTHKYSVNSFSIRIRLEDHIYIYAVINPPFVYSDDWQHYLEDHVLQMPLEAMDAIVATKFHAYSKDRHAQPYLEFLMDHERQEETTIVKADPPSFLDLVRAYEGPLIYVSLFAEYGVRDYEHVVKVIQALQHGGEPPVDEGQTGETHEIDWEFAQQPLKLKDEMGISKQAESMFTYKPPPPKMQRGGHRRLEEQDDSSEEQDDSTTETTPTLRTNLIAIDARRYMPRLGECATDSSKKVGDCITDEEHLRYRQGHRCFGERGGHPDLVSYDVIDGIYQLLSH